MQQVKLAGSGESESRSLLLHRRSLRRAAPTPTPPLPTTATSDTASATEGMSPAEFQVAAAPVCVQFAADLSESTSLAEPYAVAFGELDASTLGGGEYVAVRP